VTERTWPQKRPTLLRDVLPPEFFTEFMDTRSARLLDVEISDTFLGWNGKERRWPGTHKHVTVWWRLVDGHCVGWNENPYRGWSFPVIRSH
jgi:hypothetical protein